MANRIDASPTFMTQVARLRWIFRPWHTLPCRQIGSAYPAPFQAYAHLTLGRLGQGHLAQFKRSRSGEDGRSHRPCCQCGSHSAEATRWMRGESLWFAWTLSRAPNAAVATG